MEVVRKVIDSELIGSVIALPGSFRRRKVEVLVMLAPDGGSAKLKQTAKDTPRITRAQLEEMKMTSKVKSLCGSIPHPPITIAEIRDERLLERYGSLD